ncbi:hypothetical protein RC1_3056 [Rhodospirillum centenum SW]|uniref:Uncharacterized protein n=1 Tax=Rhodospirillum centenum (strain ATCC 51521 / SW) TaxID=414684 RepID=B6IVU8_RHOCS|nr:hypothetical protein RC1_3056 [Rhodospirillum centenum SW]
MLIERSLLNRHLHRSRQSPAPPAAPGARRTGASYPCPDTQTSNPAVTVPAGVRPMGSQPCQLPTGHTMKSNPPQSHTDEPKPFPAPFLQGTLGIREYICNSEEEWDRQNFRMKPNDHSRSASQPFSTEETKDFLRLRLAPSRVGRC